MESVDVTNRTELIICPVTGEQLGTEGQLQPVLVRHCPKCGKEITLDFNEQLNAMKNLYGTLTAEREQSTLSICYKYSHNELCDNCEEFFHKYHVDYNRSEFIRRAVAAGIPESCVFSDDREKSSVLMREIRKEINCGLYIWGDNRVGKSRAVCAIAAKLAQSRRVFYRSAEQLAMEYRGLFKDNSEENEEQWTNRIVYGYDLVIIDDIGQTTISSGFGGKLWYIAEKAITNKYQLWVISNLILPDIEDLFIRNGAAGRSIRTRIEQICKLWNPNGGFFVTTKNYNPTVKI